MAERTVFCVLQPDKVCSANCPWNSVDGVERDRIVRKTIDRVWRRYDVGIDLTYECLEHKVARQVETQIPKGGCLRG